MPKPARIRASAESFAHLAGLGRTSLAARAEDETDEEKKEREAKAQAEKDEECAAKEAKGEDTGEDEDEKEARHARQDARGASAEDDDDGDDDSDKKDMRGSGSSSQAFRRATARCAAIFASQAAGRNPVLAAELAFHSELTRSEAIRALRAAASTMPAASAHRPDRSAANPQLGSGAGAGPVNTGALWDQALAKVGVPVRR